MNITAILVRKGLQDRLTVNICKYISTAEKDNTIPKNVFNFQNLKIIGHPDPHQHNNNCVSERNIKGVLV